MLLITYSYVEKDYFTLAGSRGDSLRKWRRRPHFPTKLAAVASFSYKIGGGGKDLATLLAAVLTWSGYWT